MNDISDYHGPFQISQGKAYIKHHYVPYEIGSLELKQIIDNKKNMLAEELSKWCKLEHENNRHLEKNE
tara:strand:+ start:479 stop:682 length:204 start_codon:yes stop_codon:yes gene_type:complete